VAQLSQEIAVVQERLHEQAKNLKALEKLRERHLAELDQEGRRQERRETGEIAALQFRRFQGVGP
jgi:flagellar export protein FliJ